MFKGGGVQFVRKYSATRQTPLGPAKFTYEVYRAKTAQQAREFLEGKTVTEKPQNPKIEPPGAQAPRTLKSHIPKPSLNRLIFFQIQL